MSVMEAELAKAKLASEGIRSFISDENLAIAHPLMMASVHLQVDEADIERAENVLTLPAPTDAEGEYADEPYRCPKCHKRNVDLLPLTPGWKRARRFWVLLLLAPLLRAVLLWLLPEGPTHKRIDDITSSASLILPWLAVTLLLGVWILLLPRDKRCRDCGTQWGNNPS